MAMVGKTESARTASLAGTVQTESSGMAFLAGNV